VLEKERRKKDEERVWMYRRNSTISHSPFVNYGT
jgi:hypothetical protein